MVERVSIDQLLYEKAADLAKHSNQKELFGKVLLYLNGRAHFDNHRMIRSIYLSDDSQFPDDPTIDDIEEAGAQPTLRLVIDAVLREANNAQTREAIMASVNDIMKGMYAGAAD